ncbi:hypothetical protein O3G_MSEX008017 [Manduca sexta]|uniref:Peptidase S1 domain-containing protein n=1 Tax=Manduca sexta TaxID=7130 RepID=A0A921ZAJ6_MANSE|nr:hypothetical protein O3G_MSEX008017 [Manduca sexta]KAG6453212.1 hypothetical protein O3G_MSEX008017 [Manduca sexta]
MYDYIIFILLVFLFDNIESKKQLRIFGGRDIEENEYPHIARMEILKVGKDIMYRYHICTSAVLTPEWTLTAAHCFGDINKLLLTRRYRHSKAFKIALTHLNDIKPIIWFGNVRDEPSKNTYSDIVDSVLHPATRLGVARVGLHKYSYYQNDVGLLRTEAIRIKQYAKLSALPAVSLKGHEVEVFGYGLTNSSDGIIGDTLYLKKPLQVLTAMIASCPGGDIAKYPMLCVVRDCGHASAVGPGDSGGPLLHPSGVVATLSVGPRLDFESQMDQNFHIGTFTPISSYLDWIFDVTNNNNTRRA